MTDSQFGLPFGSPLQNGKYVVERVLGQGGFGITYLAHHTMLGIKVAIKEFFPKTLCVRDDASGKVALASPINRVAVERLRSKFIKEAQNIARLRHPGIVRIQDIFEENDSAYYVMDYIEGKPMSLILSESGRVDSDTAVEWITKTATALGHIHSAMMNHLDIKPSNIIVDTRNEPILIDFGTSKQYDEEGDETTATPVCKSPGFAPLEMYRKGGVSSFSPQTDIYSLGATLFKLITGKNPPEAADLIETAIQIPDNTEPAIGFTIRKAMAVSKADRFSSTKEFTESLSGRSISNRVSEKRTAPIKKESIDNAGRVARNAESNANHKEQRPQKLSVITYAGLIFLAIILIIALFGIIGSING